MYMCTCIHRVKHGEQRPLLSSQALSASSALDGGGVGFSQCVMLLSRFYFHLPALEISQEWPKVWTVDREEGNL